MKTAQDVLDAHAIQPHFKRTGEQILGLLQEMEPRTVTTVEDLNNLPVGAVLKRIGDLHLDVVVKSIDDKYHSIIYLGTHNVFAVKQTFLPALVIWEPKP